MATQTGSIDLKAAKQAHDDAEKVATNYVTDITNGIMVHPENDSTTGWKIADALELLKGGGTYIKAWLSGTNNDTPTVQIGQSAEGNVLIDNDSIDIRDGATTLATFGGDGVQIGVPDAGTNILIQPSGMTIRNGLDEKAIFSDELFSIGGTNGRVEFTPTKTTFYGNNGQEIVVFGHGMSTNGVFEQKLITNPTIYNETPCTVFDGRLDYEPVSDLELNATINGSDISITIPDDQDYTGVTDGLDVTYIAQTRELDAIWRGPMAGTNEYEWSTTATKTQPVTKKLAFDPVSGTEIKVQDSGLLSSGNYVTFIAGTSATKTISASFLGTAVYTVKYDGNKTITIAWKSGNDNTLFTSISYYREGVNVTKFTATYEREYRSPIFSFGSNKIDGTKAYTMLVGEGLEPHSNHQLVVGKYNAASYGGIALGNGTSDDDRSNAFEVIPNGNVFTSGSLYLNKSKEINLNWDELLTHDATKIWASDYNNTNNLYLQADGYLAFYVGDASTAPAGKMYLYTDRLDLDGYIRIRDTDRIILNKNNLTNYSPVAVYASIAGGTHNLYLQSDGYMGFYVGNTSTAPTGRMYLYYDHLQVSGYIGTGSYVRADSGFYCNNNAWYHVKNSGGTDRLLCGINGSNEYFFGYGSYTNNEGTVYYDGNHVYLRSKSAIAVNTTSFRPSSGNSVPCGTTTYYWTRFYANTAEWVKSDRKAKDVLGDLDFSEDLIMNLKPVQFMLKDSDHRRIHMGFIAQEANDVAKKIDKNLSFIIADYTDPEKGEYLGEDVDDEELTWGLSYTELIAPTIKVVQDQQRKIDKLEHRIEQLEKGAQI